MFSILTIAGVYIGIKLYTRDVKEVQIQRGMGLEKMIPYQYRDSFTTEIPDHVNLDEFEKNFMNSPVFKVESFILRNLFGFTDTTDQDWKEGTKHLAWTCITKSKSESLWGWDMNGMKGTSYFAVSNNQYGARLYFGSSIEKIDSSFAIKLHKVYSKILLRSASKKCIKSI